MASAADAQVLAARRQVETLRAQIGVAPVKAHRGQVMRKMQARTLVDLIHMSAKLRGAPDPNGEAGPMSWPAGGEPTSPRA